MHPSPIPKPDFGLLGAWERGSVGAWTLRRSNAQTLQRPGAGGFATM